MESYSVQVVLSAVDNGFTGTINSAVKSLEALQSASKAASDMVSGVGSKVETAAGSGNFFSQITDDFQKSFGNVTALMNEISKPADDLVKKFKSIVDQTGKVGTKVETVLSKMKDFGSGKIKIANEQLEKMEGSLKSGFDGLPGVKKSLQGLIPDSLEQRIRNIGPIAKGSFMMLGNKIGKASFEFSAMTGRFDKDAPKIWKVIDNIGEKSRKLPDVVSKIGTGLSKTADVGVKSMNGMVTGLTKVMGVAAKSVGPASFAGLALVGLGVLQGQFGGQIDEVIQMVTTKGPEIIQGLVSGITSKIPELANMGSTLLVSLMNMIQANIPTVASGGLQIVTALISGLTANLPQMIPAAINLITTLVTTAISMLPQILILGLQVIMSLADGVTGNMDLLMSSVMEIISTLTNAITSNLPAIISMGIMILINLAQGLIQALPTLIAAALQGMTMIIDTISQNLPVILQAGVQIIAMLIQGLVNSLPQILSSAAQMIQSLIMGIVENLPQIILAGVQIILMLVTGIAQMLPEILAAGWNIIKSLGEGLINAIPEILTSVVEGIKGLFSGLWDFITGKSEEGAENTKAKMQELSESMKASTLEAGESVKMNFGTMSADTSASTALMSDNVANALANMNATASTETGNMAGNINNAMGSVQLMSTDGLSSIMVSYQNCFSAIQNTVTSAMDSVNAKVAEAMSSFVSAVQSGMAFASIAAFTGVSQIKATFDTLPSKLFLVGEFAMSGLTSGLLTGESQAVAAAYSIANRIAATMRSALDINSPSKVTKKIGEYAGMGPAIGMLNMLPKVQSASNALAEAMQPIAASDFLGSPGTYHINCGVSALGFEGTGSVGSYMREAMNGIREAVKEQGNKTYVLEVPVTLEGREIAKGSAVYTQEELTKRAKLKQWMGGYR